MADLKEGHLWHSDTQVQGEVTGQVTNPHPHPCVPTCCPASTFAILGCGTMVDSGRVGMAVCSVYSFLWMRRKLCGMRPSMASPPGITG